MDSDITISTMKKFRRLMCIIHNNTHETKIQNKYKEYDGVSMVIIMFQRTFFVTLIGYIR